MVIVDNGSCFACGRDNPVGLGLRFALDPGGRCARGVTRLAGHFSGWKNAAHGGIVSALLDETLVYACASTGVYVATATLSVKFRRPVPLETEIHLYGEVLKNGTKFLRAASRISDPDGRLLAEGRGMLAVMRKITPEDPLKIPPEK